MNGSLALDALKLATLLIAFVRRVAENDDALAAVVAEARAEGRTVNADDVRAAVDDMRAAAARLEAKLAGA